MSWAAMEWKDGLPGRALQKIEELEQQLEKLKRERQQKQCQMDTLEQAMEKQKRKLEEDRIANARVIKENQSLLDTCEELERKRQKVEHDLQTKESYVACLEGQLSHSKQATEAEILKITQLKLELDRMTSANQALTVRSEKQANDSARLQELCNQLRKQVDDQRDQLASMQFSLKQNGGGRQPFSVHAPGVTHEPAVDNTDTIGFQQRIRELEALLAQSADEKQKAVTELHQTREFVQKDIDQANSMVLSLTQEKTNLEFNLCNKQSSSITQMASIDSSLNDSQAVLNQQINKLSAENEGLKKTLDNLKQQLQDSGLKLQVAEEKARKIQLEAECHRHNAESIRLSVDQKLKEKEKDFRLDLSQVQNELKDCANRLTQQSTNSQKEINKLSGEIESLRSQLDKVSMRNAALERQSLDERDRLASVDSLVAEHKKAVASLDAIIKALSTEKDQQLALLQDRDCQITNLNSEISSLKGRLKLADEANDAIRGKMLDYQLETESLQMRLESSLQETEMTKQTLNTEVDSLRVAVDQMTSKALLDTAKHQELTERLEKEVSERNILEQQLVDKNELRDQLTTQIKGLNEQLEALSMVHNDTVCEMNSYRASSSELLASKETCLQQISNELTNKNLELEQLKIELSQMVGQCNEGEVRAQHLQDAVVALEKSEMRLESSLQETEMIKQSLNAEVDSLRIAIDQMTSKTSLDTAKHQELTERFEKEVSERKILEQQLVDKNELCDQLMTQIKGLHEQFEALSLSHNDTVSELNSLRASSSELLASKETGLQQISDELTNTNLELEQLKIELSQMVGQCHEAEVRTQHLQDAVVALEKSEMRWESSLQETEMVKQSLSAQVDSLRVAVDQMTSKALLDTAKHQDLTERLEKEVSERKILEQQLVDKNEMCDQLTTQIKGLNEQLESLSMAHNDTVSELNNLRASSSELLASNEASLQQISDELTNKNLELEQLKIELSRMVGQCNEAEVRTQHLQDVVVALEKSEASSLRALTDRVRDVEELTEEIELMQSANKLSNQANDKLQATVQDCRDKIQYLEKCLDSTCQEYEATKCTMQSEIESLKSNAEFTSGKLSNLSLQKEELSLGLEVLKAECESLGLQLTDKDDLCCQLNDQLKTSNENYMSLQLAQEDSLRVLQGEISLAKASLASKEHELALLSEQLVHQNSELSTVRDEVIALTERCSQCEANLCAKEEHIVSLKKQEVKQSNILIDNEVEISKLKEDNISLKSFVNLSGQAQADLRRKVENYQHEIKDLKEQYEMLGCESEKMQSSLSEEVVQLKVTNNQLSDELSAVSLRLQESSSYLSTLKIEFDLVTHQLAEKDAQCDRQSSLVVNLNGKLETLQLQYTDISNTYTKQQDVFHESIESRNSDLQLLTDQLSELTKELNTVKTELHSAKEFCFQAENSLTEKDKMITLLQNSTEKQELHDKLQEKQLELNGANEKIKELSIQVELLMAVNHDAENKLLSISSDRLGLQETLESLQSKLDASNKMNDELLENLKTQEESHDLAQSEWNHRYEALSSNKALADQSLDILLIELNQAKIDVQDIVSARDKLVEKVSSLELLILKLSKDVNDSSTQKEAALLQLDTISHEKDSAELQLRSMEQHMLHVKSDCDKEIQSLRKALDCGIEEKTVLTSKLESLVLEVQHYRSLSDNLGNDLRYEKQRSQQLSQQCENQLLIVSKFEQDLKHSEVCCKSLTEQNEQYERLLNDARSSIGSCEKDKDISRKQIAQLTEENSLLIVQVETMQTTLLILESNRHAESADKIDELQKEVCRLQEQLAEDTEKHCLQFTEASCSLLELEKKISNLELMKAEQSDQLVNKENHLTRVSNELLQASYALDEKNSQIKQLEEDLITSKKQLQDRDACLESTCSKLKAAEIEIENYCSQLQNMSEDVKCVQLANADMQRENNSSHKKEIEDLKAQLEIEGSLHCARITELSNELTALKRELEDEKRVSDVLRNQLDSSSLQLADKDDEIAKYREEGRHNRIELESHLTEAEHLRLKITQLTETVVQLEEICSTMKTDTEKIKLAFSSSDAEKQDMWLHTQRVTESLDSLMAATEKQAEELRTKDHQMCILMTTLKDVELLAEQQLNEIAKLHEKLKSAEEERSQLCVVIDKMSEDNQMLNTVIEEKQILELEDEIVECRLTVEQLKKVLEADSAAKMDTETELEELKQKISYLLKNEHVKEQELSSANKTCADLQNELMMIRSAQSQLSSKVSDLEASVLSLTCDKHELEQKLQESASSEEHSENKTSEFEDQIAVLTNKIQMLEISLAIEIEQTSLGKKQVSDLIVELDLARNQEKSLLKMLDAANLVASTLKQEFYSACDREKILREKSEEDNSKLCSLKQDLDLAHKQEKVLFEKLDAANLVASTLKQEWDSARDREKTLLEKSEADNSNLCSLKHELDLAHNQETLLFEKLDAANLVASTLKQELDSACDREKTLLEKSEADNSNLCSLKHELDFAHKQEKVLFEKLDAANLVASTLKQEWDSARGREKTLLEKSEADNSHLCSLKHELDFARNQEKLLLEKLDAANRVASTLKQVLDSTHDQEKTLLEKLEAAKLSVSALRYELDLVQDKERTPVKTADNYFVRQPCESSHNVVPDATSSNNGRLTPQHSMNFSHEPSNVCDLSLMKCEPKDCSIAGRRRVVKRFTRPNTIAQKVEVDVTEGTFVKTRNDVELCDRMASSLMLEQTTTTGEEPTASVLSSALEAPAVVQETPFDSLHMSRVTGVHHSQSNTGDLHDPVRVLSSCDTRSADGYLELKDSVCGDAVHPAKSVLSTPSITTSSLIQPYALRSGKRPTTDGDGSSLSIKKNQAHDTINDASPRPLILPKMDRKSRAAARRAASVLNNGAKPSQMFDETQVFPQNVLPLGTITNSPSKSSLLAASSSCEPQQIVSITSSMLDGVNLLNNGAPVHRSKRHRTAAVEAGTTAGNPKDKECKVQ